MLLECAVEAITCGLYDPGPGVYLLGLGGLHKLPADLQHQQQGSGRMDDKSQASVQQMDVCKCCQQSSGFSDEWMLESQQQQWLCVVVAA